MENKAILGEPARVTGQSYSVALDLIKEVKKNHEIIEANKLNLKREEWAWIFV